MKAHVARRIAENAVYREYHRKCKDTLKEVKRRINENVRAGNFGLEMHIPAVALPAALRWLRRNGYVATRVTEYPEDKDHYQIEWRDV